MPNIFKKISDRRGIRGDYLLVMLVLGLTVFGVAMVFSASYYNALSKFSNPYRYLKDAVMWALAGWAAFTFFAFFNYRYLRYFAIPLMLIGIVLLGLIFTPLGLEINNAVRWLNLKYFTLMPGEIVKFSLIVFTSAFLSEKPDRIKSPTRGILPLLSIAVLCAGLIYKQPNLSTAGIVILLVVGMMFAAGLQWRWVFIGIALGIAFITVALSAPGEGYQARRLVGFWNPFSDPKGGGYQVVQGLLALGSGGVFGLGLGKSIQKTLYIPEAQNDFILAIIGEELGFVGIILLLLAYILLIWKCFDVAIRAKDFFGFMLASGSGILLALHVILNVAVVTASFPPTGVVLPFISLGGNAMVIFLSLMGIVANISAQSER